MDYINLLLQVIEKDLGKTRNFTPRLDGSHERFALENDRQSKKSGWLVGSVINDVVTATYGNWKTQEQHYFCSKQRSELSDSQWQEIEQRRKDQATLIEAEKEEKAAAARVEATEWLKAGNEATGHAYLLKKGIQALGGVVKNGSWLDAPVFVDGKLSTLQRINEDGQKRFLAGGKKRGGYLLLGTQSNATLSEVEAQELLICEGYATGCSIYEALGKPTAVAFDAGNLQAVAEHFRLLFPNLKMVFCADNDHETELSTGKNPGLDAAQKAAENVGGFVFCPDFSKTQNQGAGLSDFNDLHKLCGIDAVKTQFENAKRDPLFYKDSSRNSGGTPPIFNTFSKKIDDNSIEFNDFNIGKNDVEVTEEGGNFDATPVVLKNHGTNGTTGTKPYAARLVSCPDTEKTGFSKRDSGTKRDRNGTEVGQFVESDYVPHGFRLNEKGLFRECEKGEEVKVQRICNPLLVIGLTKGQDGAGHGLLIAAETISGNVIKKTFSASVLHSEARTLAGELEEIGVAVEPRQSSYLLDALGAMRRLASKREFLTSVPKLGWHDGEALIYQTSGGAIGGGGFVYQPKQVSKAAQAAHGRGTLEGWQDHVASVALQDQTGVGGTAILAGFAAALINPLRYDTCGIHWHGTTSRGKTTALQISASVWGDGNDPNSSSKALLQKWNATTNALEAAAEESGGLILGLDELGQFRDKNLSRAIYNLAAGQGAQRLNAAAERKTSREWQAFIVSSGEISIREAIEEAGTQQKGGVAIRVLDIPFPQNGMFGGVGAGELVNQLKRSCAEFYGTAGLAFVDYLVRSFKTKSALYNYCKPLIDEFTDTLSGGLAPEIRRAAGRFALLRVAGILAVEAKILNCSKQHVDNLVLTIWKAWRGSTKVVNDGERAIDLIRDFIVSNAGKFHDADDHEPPNFSVFGYRTKDLFLLNDDGLKAAIKGASKNGVIEALKKASLIGMNNGGDRVKSKHHINCLKTRTSFYAIRAEILEGGEAENGDSVPFLSRFVPVSRSVPVDFSAPGQLASLVDKGTVPFVPVVPEKNNNTGNVEIF